MSTVKLDGGQTCELDNAHDYGVVISFSSASRDDGRGEATISLTAAQAVDLARKLLDAVKDETALLGADASRSLRVCQQCDGSGREQGERRDLNGENPQPAVVDCGACDGTGRRSR